MTFVMTREQQSFILEGLRNIRDFFADKEWSGHVEIARGCIELIKTAAIEESSEDS